MYIIKARFTKGKPMNLIIYYDGNEYKTCGWLGDLPNVPSSNFNPNQFGLAATIEIVAIVKNWLPEQVVLMPASTITLSR